MRKFFHAFIMALALMLVTVGAASAADVVIPSTGCDIGGFITAGITAMAAIAAIAVGGYFAFLLIKKGIRWAGKAMG